MSAGAQRPARLFVERIPESGQRLELPKVAAQHVRVLRLGAGAEVELFDGRGGCAVACLEPAVGKASFARVGDLRLLPAPVATLTLVACLPKGNKLDTVVRMVTELGVSELRLAYSERTVVAPTDMAARLARWGRIALEACAQSGQPRAPEIVPPAPLLEIAAVAPPGAGRRVFWERATEPLGFPPHCALEIGPVWAVVGPEGGLSETEIGVLGELDYLPVGLGNGILRAETALIAASTLLLDRMGRLS